MLNLGTIGTSWITEQFIEAIQQTEFYHLRGIYSRSAAAAKNLAEKYEADFYTDELNNLLFDPEMDVIYIASPNSLHFEQTVRAIRAGKHVIVEKPMVLTVEQWHEVYDLAQEMGVFVFHAVRHIYTPNYKRLKQLVNIKREEVTQPFLGANFNFGQYSSKYSAYVEAINQHDTLPNVFSLEFAGGTLMDLGIYPIYVAVDLFGLPKSVRYHAVKGANMIDLFGNMILSYDSFQVNLFVSKAVHSCMPSEIYFADETLVIEGISEIAKVHLINKAGQVAKLMDYKPKNPMLDEAEHFAQVMLFPADPGQQVLYENWKQLSLQVVQVMEDLRQSAQLELHVD